MQIFTRTFIDRRGILRLLCFGPCLELCSSLRIFRRLLAFDPENAVARHLLAACISDPHYEQAPEAYELFQAKRDGCVKVVLHPNGR